jgi:tRNA-dihydrouridine synthase
LDYGIEPEKIKLEDKLEMIKKHAELLSEIRPEKVAMHKMRTHTAYYLKGHWRSSEIKPKIFKMNTKDELFDLLDEYVELIS